MGNKYLERINRLFEEIIVANRVKFEVNKWFKRDPKTNKWIELKVYESGQVSLSHSKGTATYISHLSFLLNNQGPFSLEQLVNYMYEGEFHKYYGWVEGFWDKETFLMYFQKLKEKKEPLYEVNIRDNHNAFYKTIRRFYKCKRSYRTFLLDMGENPDELSGQSLIDKFLQEGRQIEFNIVNILKKLHTPYEFFVRFPSGATPDLYNKEMNTAIDIKRSIKTNISKEINVYNNEFSEVTVIYLLGSRELVTVEEGVRKMSVYKWLRTQSYFTQLSIENQDYILKQLDNFVKSIDEGQYNSDVHDYHKMLVEQIIQYDKDGFNNPQIAEKVGVSYKYVNLILQGKALKEYSGDYPTEYKEKQKSAKEDNDIKKVKKVELSLLGVSNDEIAEKLNTSTDMVKYHLRIAKVNQKALISKRNEKIHEMLNTYTNHETLNNKFQWISTTMNRGNSEITTGVIKNYYYSHFLPAEGDKEIIKGIDDVSGNVIKLFHQGKNREEIAQALQIPITSVGAYLRKEGLGRKEILAIRNKKIEQLLKQDTQFETLAKKFERIANILKKEYPDLTACKVHTYYYVHFFNY